MHDHFRGYTKPYKRSAKWALLRFWVCWKQCRNTVFWSDIFEKEHFRIIPVSGNYCLSNSSSSFETCFHKNLHSSTHFLLKFRFHDVLIFPGHSSDLVIQNRILSILFNQMLSVLIFSLSLIIFDLFQTERRSSTENLTIDASKVLVPIMNHSTMSLKWVPLSPLITSYHLLQKLKKRLSPQRQHDAAERIDEKEPELSGLEYVDYLIQVSLITWSYHW